MKKLMLTMLFIFPGICMAVGSWSGVGKITGIMYYEDGSIHVWSDMVRHDPLSCGGGIGDRYIVSASNSIKTETYTALLAAYAAQRNVRFHIDTQVCTSSNPTIRVVELR